MTTVSRLIESISKLPTAERIVVFGSASRLGSKPKDLDIALIADDFGDIAQVEAEHSETLNSLLGLSRKYNGWLDPFVLTRKRLYVRSDESPRWKVAAQSVEMIEAIKRDGVPILSMVGREGLEPSTPGL